MAQRQLKLGAVLMGVGGPGDQWSWRTPEIPGDASVNIDWYAGLARRAEAAKFDLLFIVDSQYITDRSPNHYLNRFEPLTLLSALALATRNIGLVATISTSYNEPFNVARRLASLDLISKGRAGWNVVATGDGGTARNFSRDEHYDYEHRYGRALEHVQVAQGLWNSYEAGAFPRDKEAGVFFDPSKQHKLNHVGRYFQVEGPLNLERSPQGQPVIFQAGDSEEGRQLGAGIADGIFTHSATVAEGKAFRDDIRSRVTAAGRNADHVLIMPGISPIIRDTVEEARAHEASRRETSTLEQKIALLGRPFGWHDFSQYDLDAPFPELGDLGNDSFKTHADSIKRTARENSLTLRETVEHLFGYKPGPFVGTAQSVAAEIEEWFLAGALDGLNIHITAPSEFARFTDEVLPILRERGIVREDYQGGTLRENLGLPIPANVHERAANPAGAPEFAGAPA
ncbi:MAG: FMN-dependent oxidoreductase, nitrilotriacetate monooxygenase family [Pseudarthrobacter sp.]|nr:FMN-dependent oxidoreductase, nitrilotriacetate monooxygenase family [Pseudarthrobacter sp.]